MPLDHTEEFHAADTVMLRHLNGEDVLNSSRYQILAIIRFEENRAERPRLRVSRELESSKSSSAISDCFLRSSPATDPRFPQVFFCAERCPNIGMQPLSSSFLGVGAMA